MSKTEETREGFHLSEEGEWVPDGWKFHSLGELSTFSYGKMPSKEDLKRGGEFPTFSGYKYQYTYPESNCSTGDLIVVARGVGGTGDIKLVREDCYLTNLSIKIDPDDSLLLKPFFYYAHQLSNLRFLDSGSAQSQITISDLSRYSFKLPLLSEQKAIVAVLSSLDDKIELLREQNETLEALAQTLFKRWFIDFNFPDKNGNPYKDSGGTMIPSELGEIPEGWVEVELGDVVTVKRGGSPRPIKDFITTGEGLRWLKISDATATKSPYIHKIKEKIIKEGLRKTTHLESGKLILSNSATPGIPKFIAVDTCIHDGWLHFPETGHLTQEYLYLLFLKIRPELLQQGNGSVFKNLKTDILKQHIIHIPSKSSDHGYLLHGFESQFHKINTNSQQIQSLTQLRDILLPKLMKGELRIKNNTL